MSQESKTYKNFEIKESVSLEMKDKAIKKKDLIIQTLVDHIKQLTENIPHKVTFKKEN